MWRDPPSRRDPLGSYYLLVSGLSGWRPNAAVLYLTLHPNPNPQPITQTHNPNP